MSVLHTCANEVEKEKLACLKASYTIFPEPELTFGLSMRKAQWNLNSKISQRIKQGLQIVLVFQQAQKYNGTVSEKNGLQMEGFCPDIFVAAVF